MKILQKSSFVFDCIKQLKKNHENVFHNLDGMNMSLNMWS